MNLSQGVEKSAAKNIGGRKRTWGDTYLGPNIKKIYFFPLYLNILYVVLYYHPIYLKYFVFKYLFFAAQDKQDILISLDILCAPTVGFIFASWSLVVFFAFITFILLAVWCLTKLFLLTIDG
jgi:hypothetical protein